MATFLSKSLRQPKHQQLDFVRRMGVFYGQVSQNANSSVKRRGFTDKRGLSLPDKRGLGFPVKRRGFTDNLKKNDDLKEHVLQIIIGNKQNQNVSTLD